MIIRSGSQICNYCEQLYEWEALKKDDKAIAIFGSVKKGLSNNVDFFGVINGCRLIATSTCPYCHKKQINNLVDKAWSQ